MPGEPGGIQEFVYEGFPFDRTITGKVIYFALQTRDEAGNLSALSGFASISYEVQVEPVPEPQPVAP